MKFECDKSLLSAAIDGVSRAITNRAAIPVLEGIYLKAEGFQLTLTGYDMEMGITTNIECNVQVPGETVLEAKLFGSMVSRMPSGTVSVELNNEGMARLWLWTVTAWPSLSGMWNAPAISALSFRQKRCRSC